jgi:hypothetical protein
VNTLEPHEPVSGFVFAVFTGDEGMDPLTLPVVNLVSGRPADVDRGRYFVISNSNVVRFDTTVQASPAGYKSVTVFIYDRTGEFLSDKVFPVEISDVPQRSGN